jgi:release factor glutamine methyltransferase
MSQASAHFAAGSVGETLREGVRRLETSSVGSAGLAAELLLMKVIARGRAWLYAHPEQFLSAEDVASYFDLITARAAGTPTQYLTGKQEFWGLDFEVSRDVLIPRPETEHVIEVSIARLGEARRNASMHVADIGTGSGCIAVALTKELPGAKICATDISAAALEVAGRNAARHGFEGRINFVESDLLRGIAEPARFDVIVSNPPYIARRDADYLPREVRDHEPGVALFAGDDGLAVYSPLIAQAAERLAPGGLLVLELGAGQFDPVSELLDAARGWTRVSATADLAGIIRVISAVKN